MIFMNKHLLVVDDNSVNIELLLDLLDDHGFDNVHGLSDPRHVLAYCQQQLPDLILLDIRMPGTFCKPDAPCHCTDRPN